MKAGTCAGVWIGKGSHQAWCRCLGRPGFPLGMVQVFGKARVPIRHGADVWEGQGSRQVWCRCLGREGFLSGDTQCRQM